MNKQSFFDTRHLFLEKFFCSTWPITFLIRQKSTLMIFQISVQIIFNKIPISWKCYFDRVGFALKYVWFEMHKGWTNIEIVNNITKTEIALLFHSVEMYKLNSVIKTDTNFMDDKKTVEIMRIVIFVKIEW